MLSDADLLAGFESCTLANTAFGHREHVRVAWLYVRAEPFERAAMRFCTNLRRFAEAHGKPGLYHETITWAYLALVNERRDACPVEDLDVFAATNADLFDNANGVLLTRYDRETLRSERARRVFLLPTR
ncbi:MAG: hypothetical protein ACLQVI_43435 [Polyangiaceae bacterium]|jgi:hypothetical protein